jgi:hypothetical protein
VKPTRKSHASEYSHNLKPTAPPLTTRNSFPTKQYKYWIDVQDLLNLLNYAFEKLKATAEDRAEETKIATEHIESSLKHPIII